MKLLRIFVAEPIPHRLKLSAHCDETTLSKSVGEPAKFLCRVDFTEGQPQENDMTVQWQKISVCLCYCYHLRYLILLFY